MTFRYRGLFILAAAGLALGACSSTDATKQANSEGRMDTATAMAPTGTQNPGEDQSFQGNQMQRPVTASEAVIQATPAQPIDPSSLPTPSNSSQLPRPDLTQGGQGGSPVSETPAQVPQRAQGAQNTSGRPVSEMPVGNQGSGGSDTRASSVEAALISRPGFQQVTVSIGGDGCVVLEGTVKTEPKKEEAAAIARGASGLCVVNRIVVR
jgi:BON domain